MKAILERRTGFMFGTYRWLGPDNAAGPAPVLGFVLRPANDTWVRCEFVVRGRAFYLTWGRQA